jgi:hypothetical protein
MSHGFTECTGNSEGHCCWLNGTVCQYLEENTVVGRRWACGLLRELGTWDAVYADSRYVSVREALDQNPSLVGLLCGDWPRIGETCGECGVVGAAD